MSDFLNFLSWVLDISVQPTTDSRANAKNISKPTYIESSIRAMADQAIKSYTESTKKACADRIFEILANNWDDIPESTVTYAIKRLEDISSKCYLESTKNHISYLIYKIAV